MKAIEFSSLVPGTLMVVWNAESGWQQALLDSLHKWVSPATYSCNLCQLTHGGLGAKQAWKDFVQNSDRPIVFFHRDEFEPLQQREGLPDFRLPTVLELKQGGIEVLLSAEQIEDLPDLPALLKALESRL
jgi:hypothetical protein